MNTTSRDQTSIIALCTPRGSGALALLRLTGPDAVTIADRITKLSSGTSLADTPTHTINHGRIVDPSTDETIDEVMFMLMRAPHTFTGDDTIEITTHNNPFIIDRILTLACEHGARMAQPGEFSQRAYLNGKIDLIKAEAINDVIHAHSEYALKRSLAQLEGSLSSFVSEIEQDLLHLYGMCQASFEFLDEEQRDLDFAAQLNVRLQSVVGRVKESLAGYGKQQHLSEGVRIAFVGSVNAGKSTLFNALLGKDRAIVTPVEGTTRDTIEASKRGKDVFWLLVDTAGLRETNDQIEREGIERSKQEAHKADVVLLVVDGSSAGSEAVAEEYKELHRQFGNKCIVVSAKADLTPSGESSFLDSLGSESVHCVSAETGEGLSGLEAAINDQVQKLFSSCTSPYLLNQRHFESLSAINTKLAYLVERGPEQLGYEVVAVHLRDALEDCASLTGKAIDEEMMNGVFRSFCVGK